MLISTRRRINKIYKNWFRWAEYNDVIIIDSYRKFRPQSMQYFSEYEWNCFTEPGFLAKALHICVLTKFRNYYGKHILQFKKQFHEWHKQTKNCTSQNRKFYWFDDYNLYTIVLQFRRTMFRMDFNVCGELTWSPQLSIYKKS